MSRFPSVYKSHIRLAAVFAGALLVSACEQDSALRSQSAMPDRPPTTEATVLAEHTALPHAVAAIEISLARIGYLESFGGNRPGAVMLQLMETLPDRYLHWDAIPADQRDLLRRVAKRLAVAHERYTSEFQAESRPMADFDAQEIIGSAVSDAVTDEPEARALREIYDAWPSLFR